MNDRRRTPVWKVQFGLHTLLIVAPLAAAVVAWVATLLMRTEVTAYMRILPKPYAIYDPPVHPRTDLIEATPDDILLGAMESLSPNSRAWIESNGDAIVWIRRNVRITVIEGKLLRIAIVNHAPKPDETAVEKDVVNAITLSFSKAAPSEFHKLFCRYPFGIEVIREARVDHNWQGWF